jgi:hypothetical protein
VRGEIMAEISVYERKEQRSIYTIYDTRTYIHTYIHTYTHNNAYTHTR